MAGLLYMYLDPMYEFIYHMTMILPYEYNRSFAH
jgi:hypothetical protein